jgi:biopolymer transport protein ExbB
MSKKMSLVALVAVFLFSVCSFVSVVAQDPAPAAGGDAAAPAVAAPKEKSMTVWQFWCAGGWAMWPLGATSVVSLGLTIFGFMQTRTEKMLRPDLIPQIQENLEKQNIEEAMNICNSNPCIMTNILTAGLRRLTHGVLDVASMEKAMEEASVEETQAGLRPITVISLMAMIAPMLGLLGTVDGMISAFNKIGMGMMGNPEKLAEDIGVAMITTWTGLVVAIPAMFFYFFLKTKYIAQVARCAKVLGDVTHHLVVSTTKAQTGGEAAAESRQA